MINIQKILNYFYLGRYATAEKFKGLFGFFFLRIYLIIIIGLNLLVWTSAYIINNNVSEELAILHYNVDFGANLIGNIRQIYIIPFLGFIIILFNFLLFFIIYQRGMREVKNQDKFLAGILFISAGMANLFLLFSLISIYLINFLK